MKKLKLLLSLSILFFALYSCNEQLDVQGLESTESIDSKKPVIKAFETLASDADVNYCGEKPVECTLKAGQHIDAGLVTIMNDDEYLYVKVYSEAGFQDVDENIKMWIGTEVPDKRLPAGHFPYKVTESGNTHIFQIPLSSLSSGDDVVWDGECGVNNTDPLIIIVHADVITKSGSSETAFGGCEEGQGRGAWWYYMNYVIECCDEEEELLNAFGVKHNNTQSSCASDVWTSWVFGGWLNGYTEENPFKGMVLYLEDNDNCDNFDNQIVGHIEINIMDNDVNTLKIKYVITDDHYALSGIDFSIKELDIDTDYRNFKEPVDMESEYTLYIPWSGNINHNEQLLYFIQQAKVVMK